MVVVKSLIEDGKPPAMYISLTQVDSKTKFPDLVCLELIFQRYLDTYTHSTFFVFLFFIIIVCVGAFWMCRLWEDEWNEILNR